jgi:hypothetical protein
MTLFWIEEGFVAEDQFDRLAGMPKPGALIHILSTPRHDYDLFRIYLKKGERMPDNWKHRSEGMRCKTCMFFVPKPVMPRPQPPNAMMMEGESYELGRCRRHAPTMGGWPVLFVNDWCGDHKLDEEKI